MKKLVVIGIVIALVASFAISAQPFGASVVQAASSQTYQVIVGYENPTRGALIEAFFPENVTIHVGDTVHWVQASHEIHTVTFLAGAPVPPIIMPNPAGLNPSPLMFNPQAVVPAEPINGQYDGTAFANSGLMSLDTGNRTSFDLTFTKVGTYTYICLVHGIMMSGTVTVVGSNQSILTPAQSAAAGKAELSVLKDQIGAVFDEANAAVTPPSQNADGSKTYHVMLGYAKDQIDLMRFFPSSLNVRKGDTVVWNFPENMSGMEMPPHTVTFLNGTADPSLTIPNTFYINPTVLFPAQPGQPLTRYGYFNSGLMQTPATYSLRIGDVRGLINYMCLLHDMSGMVGRLNVLP